MTETPTITVTNCKFTMLSDPNGKAKAMTGFCLNSLVYITGCRIIEGKNGLFLSMPSRKGNDGEYHDVCFPASKAVRDAIQAAVLAEYDKQTGPAAPAADIPF